MSQPNNDMQQSRVLLIASGILFLLIGFAAMSLPMLFTAVIVKALAIFILLWLSRSIWSSKACL